MRLGRRHPGLNDTYHCEDSSYPRTSFALLHLQIMCHSRYQADLPHMPHQGSASPVQTCDSQSGAWTTGSQCFARGWCHDGKSRRGKPFLSVARALLGDWLLGDIVILAGPTAKKVRSNYDEDVILEQVLGLIHAML